MRTELYSTVPIEFRLPDNKLFFKKIIYLLYFQAHTLRRNCKSFDAKRTTYQVMKTVLDNRIAEMINMEGRRGEKLAFSRLELCTLITCIINKNILPITLIFSNLNIIPI